jgi:copper(I)-binding protein
MRQMVFPALSALFLVVLAIAGAGASQRTVSATDGWVKAPAEGAAETSAFVTVQNGTMYDVYAVGAQSDVAGVVELRQASKGGAATVAKEVTVPAFDRLDMSPDGVYIHLGQLKRPLKPGETVDLSILIDNGGALAVTATVK